MGEKIDIFSIEKMCKELALKGDYKTLAHLVRVNRKIHETCQKYLDRVKKEQQQLDKDMEAIEQGDYELRLYPEVDPKTIDFDVFHEQLMELLRSRYGPTVYLDGDLDAEGHLYFDVVDWGEDELGFLINDFQQNGYKRYNKIRYDLAYVVNGRKVTTFNEFMGRDQEGEQEGEQEQEVDRYLNLI